MEKKDVEVPNKKDKLIKAMKVKPIIQEREQKVVNRKRTVKNAKNSVNTKDKSLKKEKTLNQNKETQTSRDKKDLDKTI